MNFRYKLGLRAIKTAVAVFLCILVSFLLKKESAFYAAIAAVVCMQPTYEKTFQIGLHRFIGTVIGGIAGFILLELSQIIPFYHQGLYLLLVPVFLLGIIYFCNCIGRKNSVSICCIVFLSITVNFTRDIPNTIMYVLTRVFDTTVGIIFAMLVNRFLFPSASSATDMPIPPDQTISSEKNSK